MLLIRGVLGIGLPKLSAVQGALLQRAKKYAMEVSGDHWETTTNHYSPATGVHKVGADEANNGSSAAADKVPPTTASSLHHEQVKIFVFKHFH